MTWLTTKCSLTRQRLRTDVITGIRNRGSVGSVGAWERWRHRGFRNGASLTLNASTLLRFNALTTLELPFVIRFPARGRSRNPVRGSLAIEFEAEEILSKQPSQQANRSNYKEKEYREQHVGNNKAKNDSQRHPGNVNVLECPGNNRS